jgi:hypothetical protein
VAQAREGLPPSPREKFKKVTPIPTEENTAAADFYYLQEYLVGWKRLQDADLPEEEVTLRSCA